jgi:hypothetical protein
MAVQQLPPAPVADLGGTPGGVDDVGEKHRSEDAVVIDAVATAA